jgi:hypothetical protein
MTATTAASLTETIVASTRPDSFVPNMTNSISTITSPAATHPMPSAPLACSTKPDGTSTPNPFRVATRYSAQYLETKAAAITSSSTSAQPTTQAQISPNAT